MTHWLKFVMAVFGIAVIIGAGWFLYDLWDMSRQPFSLRKLSLLHSQMDTNDVRHLLGDPSSSDLYTNELEQVSIEWTYSRQTSWPEIMIYFRSDGHYDGYIRD
jgi:hypothetical protein